MQSINHPPSKWPVREGILLSVLLAALQFGAQAFGQGCVAARGGTCFHLPGTDIRTEAGFQASVGYRWLHSDRHFVGDTEHPERQAEGSEVINDSHYIELGLTYNFNPRWSVNLYVPFVFNDRSQVVRSNDVARTILTRYATQSYGIGDIRVTGGAWILDPVDMPKANLLVSMGFDAPTGQKDATDTFQVFDNASRQIVARERTVDQSIQPGDGGWSILAEIYGYYTLTERLNAYVNGAYYFTPEEMSGVPTFRGGSGEAIMSIADTYMGRVGVDYVLFPKLGISASLGGRIEGVPVYDAIGGSLGFRRPGFAISVEPGVMISRNDWTFGVTTPVAVYRNREQSVPDKMATPSRHGDAAFADFLVLATISRRF